MTRLFALWQRIAAFFDHPDARVALGGTVALAVAGNQPFYPFYAAYAADAWIGPAFVTWMSTPFFVLAPALARRSPDAGRALLIAAAVGNTILTAVALGPASGVEVFYLPSLLVSGLVFPAGQRIPPLAAAAVAAAAGLFFARSIAPWVALTPAQDHSLAIMHVISAACVTGLMLIVAYRRVWRPRAAPSRSGASRSR